MLSIVVELDADTLHGVGPLVAVVAETLAAGKRETRLERVGRPEIKNLVLAHKQFDPVNRDLEIRDLYNLEDAFRLAESYLGAYRARFNANLAFYDTLDGKTDWPLRDGGAHPLTELLLADFLVVDVSKPFSAESYFEIEQAMLAARPHATHGGRSLHDDVHRHAPHHAHQRRKGTAHPGRRGPGHGARDRCLSLPRTTEASLIGPIRSPPTE